jgi:hypothetical protein
VVDYFTRSKHQMEASAPWVRHMNDQGVGLWPSARCGHAARMALRLASPDGPSQKWHAWQSGNQA